MTRKERRTTSKLGGAIDAVDLGIRRYLLHRHLAHWYARLHAASQMAHLAKSQISATAPFDDSVNGY